MQGRAGCDGGDDKVKHPGRVQLEWAYYLSLLPGSRVVSMNVKVSNIGVVSIISLGHCPLREWNLQGLY